MLMIVLWSVVGSNILVRRTNIKSKPTLQGIEAVEALLEATPNTPSFMIGVQENKITRVPLMEAVAMAGVVLVWLGFALTHTTDKSG